MVIAVVQDRPNVGAVASQDLLRVSPAEEKKIQEEIARQESQSAAPQEIARAPSAPVAAQKEASNTKDPLTQDPTKLQGSNQPSIDSVSVSRNLIIIAPEAELSNFSNEGSTLPSSINASIPPTETEASTAIDATNTTEESVAKTESSTQETSDKNLADTSTRDAVETITQALPAKAGSIVDLSV